MIQQQGTDTTFQNIRWHRIRCFLVKYNNISSKWSPNTCINKNATGPISNSISISYSDVSALLISYSVLFLQWNLYRETGKVLPKTHKFHHKPGMVFTKSGLFSPSWETTCLERPHDLVVVLYRFHCICLWLYWGITQTRYLTLYP